MTMGETAEIGTAEAAGTITGALIMAEEDTEEGITRTGEGDGIGDTMTDPVSRSERNIARSHFHILFLFEGHDRWSSGGGGGGFGSGYGGSSSGGPVRGGDSYSSRSSGPYGGELLLSLKKC